MESKGGSSTSLSGLESRHKCTQIIKGWVLLQFELATFDTMAPRKSADG